MYVYFMLTRQPKRIKIGKSNNPVKRMNALQTGCPTKITLIGAIKCKDDNHAMKVEKSFHEFFNDKRKNGEWFYCTDYLLTRIWDVLNQLEPELQGIKSLTATELADLNCGLR